MPQRRFIPVFCEMIFFVFIYSAGVGRTGVFLAIDTILDKLEKGVINSIDVFGEVCTMRERRMNMVQTLVWIPISVIILILANYQNYRSSTITKILFPL